MTKIVLAGTNSYYEAPVQEVLVSSLVWFVYGEDSSNGFQQLLLATEGGLDFDRKVTWSLAAGVNRQVETGYTVKKILGPRTTIRIYLDLCPDLTGQLSIASYVDGSPDTSAVGANQGWLTFPKIFTET